MCWASLHGIDVTVLLSDGIELDIPALYYGGFILFCNVCVCVCVGLVICVCVCVYVYICVGLVICVCVCVCVW